ncbi:hypothetical protein [Deinococcus sp.]|uniref:hypothetical protein n=1 Tax=Deinococcus sp. TaxID=47478 RepID=UPI003CC5EB1E
MTPPDSRPDLTRRLHKLAALGGLPPVGVRNDEWLYMLQQETRQSLSIEGYVTTDSELRAVLSGRRSGPEILNYFRAAQSVYDLALQQHREQEVAVSLALVRHVHSEVFRELDERRGLFRTGSIQITGARVRPPEHDMEGYVRAWLELIPTLLARWTPLGEPGASCSTTSPSAWAGRRSSLEAPKPPTGNATTWPWKRETRGFTPAFRPPRAWPSNAPWKKVTCCRWKRCWPLRWKRCIPCSP